MTLPENDPVAVPTEQPTPEEPPKIWPNAPAVEGQIYAVQDANNDTMVAMTMQTWERIQAQLRSVTDRLEVSNAENVLLKRQLLSGGQRQGKIILPGLV